MKKVVVPEYDHYLYIYVTTCSFVLKTVIVVLLEMDATFMSTKEPSLSVQKDVSEVGVYLLALLCYGLFV